MDISQNDIGITIYNNSKSHKTVTTLHTHHKKLKNNSVQHIKYHKLQRNKRMQGVCNAQMSDCGKYKEIPSCSQ